jgi:hypothetical protein
MATITIEVANAGNRALLFKPTQTRVRGAIDFVSTRDPELYRLGMDFDGKTIPGQRITLDTEKGEGLIYDPLKAAPCAEIAAKIVAKLASPIGGGGVKIAEPKKFDKVHAATWLYHMRRAVEAGHAVVVQGDLNTPVEGEPQREFLHKREPVKDKRDDTIEKLTALVTAQSEQIAKLLAANGTKK